MHPAQWSSRAYACADGGSDSGRFTGSRCSQAVCAASNAGDAELIPGTLTLNPPPFEVGSGKPDTPCERMQRANLSPSRCAWAWLGPELELAGEPELSGELEPHAAITALARTTATTDRSLGATQDTAQLLPCRRSHHCNSRSDLPPTGGARRLPPGLAEPTPLKGVGPFVHTLAARRVTGANLSRSAIT
jgi:hypothetical protein